MCDSYLLIKVCDTDNNLFFNPIQHSFALLNPLKPWKNLKIFWRFQVCIAVQNWAEIRYSFINFLKKFSIVNCFPLCLKCWSTLYCSWLLICVVSNNRVFFYLKLSFHYWIFLEKVWDIGQNITKGPWKGLWKRNAWDSDVRDNQHQSRKFIIASSEDLRTCLTWLRDKQHLK